MAMKVGRGRVMGAPVWIEHGFFYTYGQSMRKSDTMKTARCFQLTCVCMSSALLYLGFQPGILFDSQEKSSSESHRSLMRKAEPLIVEVEPRGRSAVTVVSACYYWQKDNLYTVTDKNDSDSDHIDTATSRLDFFHCMGFYFLHSTI